jgi:hypothetical protein
MCKCDRSSLLERNIFHVRIKDDFGPKVNPDFFKKEKKKSSSFLKIQNDNISISKYSTTILACEVEDKGNTQ